MSTSGKIESKQYILGRDATLIAGISEYIDKGRYADNYEIGIIGQGVALGIKFKDNQDNLNAIKIMLNKQQAKALVKELKRAVRGIK